MFSNLGWNVVKIWVFLCVYPHSLQSHNGLPWKPWNFKNQRAFIFKNCIFLHLSGPIGQIYAHNEMSYVFNLGMITLFHTIVYPCFSLIFTISLIFMNTQMGQFSYRTTGWKNLSNWITEDIKNGNNGGLMMFFCAEICSFMLFFMILLHFCRFSLIFVNMQIRWFTNLITGRKTVSKL